MKKNYTCAVIILFTLTCLILSGQFREALGDEILEGGAYTLKKTALDIAAKDALTGSSYTLSSTIGGVFAHSASGSDFVLKDGLLALAAEAVYSVTGTVTDAVSQNPLSGVEIAAWDDTDEEVASVETDGNGDYILYNLPAGTYKVGVKSVDNYHFAIYADAVAYDGEITVEQNFALPQCGIFTGTVTDAVSTDPVSGVVVTALESSDYQPVQTALSNAAGAYTLKAAAGDYVIAVDTAGTNYAVEVYDGQPYITRGDLLHIENNQQVSDINFALKSGVTLNVTVINQVTQQPITSEEVYFLILDAASGELAMQASNEYFDENGIYHVTLAAGEYKILAISLMLGGHYYEQYYDGVAMDSFSGADIIELDPVTNPVNITLSMVPFQGGMVYGTLTDSQTSEPINAGIVVPALDATNGTIMYVGIPEADGSYSLALADGDYKIMTMPYEINGPAANYLTEFYDNQPSFTAANVVSVNSGAEDIYGIDFALQAGGTLSGTVTDGAQNPLPNIEINVVNTSQPAEYYEPIFTDFNGNYEIDKLGAGAYRIQAVPAAGTEYQAEYYDNTPTLENATLVNVAVGEEVEDIDFSLASGGLITNVSIDDRKINPIQSETCEISYTISEAATMTVSIWDKEETLIKNITDTELKSAGNHSITWDGKNAGGQIVDTDYYTFTIAGQVNGGVSDEYAPGFDPEVQPLSSFSVDEDFNAREGEPCEVDYTVSYPTEVYLWVQHPVNYIYLVNNIATVVHKPALAGNYTAYWDGRDDDGAIVDGWFNVIDYSETLPENFIIVDKEFTLLTNVSAQIRTIIPGYDQISHIYFSLSETASITVKIYDPNGNYCATLEDDETYTVEGAGANFTVDWDGRDDDGDLISVSGDYNVEITAEKAAYNHTETARATLQVFE